MSQFLLALCLFMIAAQIPTSKIRDWRAAHESQIIRELVEFLSIPNVASDRANIRRNAEKLVEVMARRGISARLIETRGSPLVFGELKVPGAARTIAFYAHYDGQPVDPSEWETPPFEPALRDGPGGRLIPFPRAGEKFDPEWRIYARSASDDKAPIVAMLAALDALRATGASPTSNLKFLFDGEEEAGSPHLEEAVRENADLLKADVWICADGPVHQSRRQSLYFGVRGIVTVNITVYGPRRPLHSGHYGNWAPNPAMRLAKLLASMKDDKGRVTIEGFYDDAEPLGAEERRALNQLPRNDAELMREFGIAQTENPDKSLAELINEPSLNISGLRSEHVGEQARTVIPAEATAALDLRLVKGMDPRRQLERLIAHIRKQGYLVVDREPTEEERLRHPLIARVTSRDGYPAARTPIGLPIAQRIISAVEAATGEKPLLLPTLGGSGPLSILHLATGAPQIGVPIVNHDNNQHSSNENLRIKNLWDGIEIFAALMAMP